MSNDAVRRLIRRSFPNWQFTIENVTVNSTEVFSGNENFFLLQFILFVWDTAYTPSNWVFPNFNAKNASYSTNWTGEKSKIKIIVKFQL